VDPAVGKPFVIAIAGGSGSGKTVLAHSLVSVLSSPASVMLAQDSYYRSLPDEYRSCPNAYNFDHPEALEWDLLAHHLDALRRAETAEIPRYSFVTHQRIGTEVLTSAPFVILEGTLILHDPRLVERVDLRIFLEIDPDIRLLRRIARDTRERGRSVESVLEQYTKTVKPMYDLYVAPQKQKADLVLREGSVEEWTRAVLARVETSRKI